MILRVLAYWLLSVDCVGGPVRRIWTDLQYITKWEMPRGRRYDLNEGEQGERMFASDG